MKISVITVHARTLGDQLGWLSAGPLWLACALGRGGRRALKCEGDGATPIGAWPMRRVLYRADRVARPRTLLPVSPIARTMAGATTRATATITARAFALPGRP